MKACITYVVLVLFCLPAFSQNDWKSMNLPFTLSDAHFSDTLIAILSPTFDVAVSQDEAETWDQYSTKPTAEALALTSIQANSVNAVYLYGSNHFEESHQVFHVGAASTTDGGLTWGYGFWPQSSFPAHLHILSRTPHRWFIGTHSKNDLRYGAIDVKDSKTNTVVFRGSSLQPSLMSAIDIKDSICLGYRFQVSASGPKGMLCRSVDLGRTWDSILPMKAEFTSRPVIRSGSGSTWMMSYDSVLLRSDDTGLTWHNVLQTERPIEDFQLYNNVGIVVLRGADFLLASSDFGMSWSPVFLKNISSLEHVQIVNDTIAYCFGPDALIRKGRSLDVGITKESQNVAIWPNPVSTVLNIRLNSTHYPVRYSIWSQLGTQVLQGTMETPAARITLSECRGGVYTLSLTDVQGIQSVERIVLRK